MLELCRVLDIPRALLAVICAGDIFHRVQKRCALGTALINTDANIEVVTPHYWNAQ